MLLRIDLCSVRMLFGPITGTLRPFTMDVARRPVSLRRVCSQLLMPPAVSQDLERAGLLYLEQRDTGRQHSFGARMNVGSPRSPFHLNCTIPVSTQTCTCTQC